MRTKFLIIFKKISPFLSHSRQRKDKVCLNCNAEIYGRYCHQCGQENIEPKESVWGLVTHFLYDITHFDGKFFSTLKYLLFRPGLLSREYIKGRRASYLHPIKMYVFTSAFFFIVFFSLFNFNKAGASLIGKKRDSTRVAIADAKVDALKEARTKQDSVIIERALKGIELKGLDSINEGEHKESDRVEVKGVTYTSVAQYDSAQRALPAAKRDGWYKRTKTQKMIAFKQAINKDPQGFMGTLFDQVMHTFPQLLFVSLPIFALLLKLLYIRRKQFYYADHAIFTIHLYIFTFIALFILMMLNQLQDRMHWDWVKWPATVVVLYTIYYTYRSLKNFYMQGHIKTFLKFWLLNTLSFFMITFLFILFILLSIFKI
jgi:hypothetical protein